MDTIILPYLYSDIFSHIILKYFNVRPHVIFFSRIDFTVYLFIENRSRSRILHKYLLYNLNVLPFIYLKALTVRIEENSNLPI